MKRHSLLAFAALATLLFTGCASSGYKKADSASTSVQKAAQGIDKSSRQIDAVLAALTDLLGSTEGNLKPKYKKFAAAVSSLESEAKSVSRKSEAMQKQGAAYFTQWDKDLATIQNEDIRTRSEDRRRAVASRFEKLGASYEKVRSDFLPFLSDVTDIRTALANDLTVGGLAEIKPVAGKAEVDAVPLRASLGQLSADFNALGVALAPKISGQ
jgi:outer membrane murein-binding lipoprotein Lpp